MNGIFARANCAAWAIMPSRPSGASTPIVMLPSTGTSSRAGVVHRARVECGELVRVEVGRDVGLRRVLVFDDLT